MTSFTCSVEIYTAFDDFTRALPFPTYLGLYFFPGLSFFFFILFYLYLRLFPLLLLPLLFLACSKFNLVPWFLIFRRDPNETDWGEIIYKENGDRSRYRLTKRTTNNRDYKNFRYIYLLDFSIFIWISKWFRYLCKFFIEPLRDLARSFREILERKEKKRKREK